MPHTPTLLHVTTPEAYAAAQLAGVLQATPFLHLCTDEQLPFVLARHFPAKTGLLVLRLDPTALDIRWEASEPGMPPFPHLYGPAPIDRVSISPAISHPQSTVAAEPPA